MLDDADAGTLLVHVRVVHIDCVDAADEAAAVGMKRQALHHAVVMRESAQDGAIVDVEELDGLVARAGERVLVVSTRRYAGLTARHMRVSRM